MGSGVGAGLFLAGVRANGEDVEVLAASNFLAFVHAQLVPLVVQALDFSDDAAFRKVSQL